MKASDIHETYYYDPVTGGIITAIDGNGRPVAGRYRMNKGGTDMASRFEGLAKRKEIQPVEEITEKAKTETVNQKAPSPCADAKLTPEEERRAEGIAVKKSMDWIRLHHGYTLDGLRSAKAVYLAEAREEVLKERREKMEKARQENAQDLARETRV